MWVETKMLRGGARVAHVDDEKRTNQTHINRHTTTNTNTNTNTLDKRIETNTDLAKQQACYKLLVDLPLRQEHHDDDSAKRDALERAGYRKCQLAMACALQHPTPHDHEPSSTVRLRLLDPARDAPAHDADAGPYVALLAQLSTAPPLSPADFAATYDEQHRSGCTHVMVMERLSDGRLVGCATLLRREARDGDGARGHLEDVVVDGEARGTGLGRELVMGVLGLARSLGCAEVRLNCKESNEAFYRKCGFVTVGDGYALYL